MANAPSEVLINKPSAANEGNLIFDIASQIEQLKDNPAEVYSRIDNVQNNKSMDDFKLGGLLALVQSSKWYKDDGFSTFKDFLAERYPTIEYRKSKYLIDMYNSLLAAEVDWEDVKDIGWSKLARLSSVLTKENASEWIKKASENNVLDLLAMIKVAKGGGGDADGIVSEPIVKQNFALHQDQKAVVDDALAKAKVEAETDFDSVALDAICQNYLSGESVAAPVALDLKAAMGDAGYNTVLEIFGILWPEIEVHVAVPESM